MKHLFIFLIGLFFFSCSDDIKIVPSGNLVEESRTVSDFISVDVANGISVFLSQKENDNVVVEADDNIIQYVETYTDGHTLYVRIKDGIDIKSTDVRKTVNVKVSTLDLENISASGGSKIQFVTPFSLDVLSLAASGGPDIRGELHVDDFSCSISGGGKSSLEGDCKNVSIIASGGSECHFYDLLSDNMNIEISGGSIAELFVNKTLKVFASGGSKIYYKGEGEIIEQVLDGGSIISKQN